MSAPAKAAGLPIGVDNQQIAEVFEEIAELLALQDANPFRIRAYRNAARTLRGEEHPLAERIAAGQALPKLPGIGHDLTEKITELARSGECQLLNRLRREVPPGLGELLQLPGIGPKRAHQLYHELGVDSLAALREAVAGGRVRRLSGFGRTLEDKLRRALASRTSGQQRYLLPQAAAQAGPLLDYLKQLPLVERALIAGSYRRRRDTVGDLDVLLQADAQDGQAMAAVLRFPAIAEVFASGATRASLGLRGGMQVDVRIVAADSFGAALQYFTGSKAHGIALRRRAQAQGCKLNEYGLFRDGNKLAGRNEADIYQALGLPPIPPELREDSGEIDAAEHNRLPRLIELDDLRGDLHCHTNASDGHDSLRQMALAAQRRGWQYLAITEHSRRLSVAHGLDTDRLLRQLDEIDRLNDELHGLTLLKGIEVEILADGSLDLPDELLARLDIVVGAVHSHYQLSRARQTARLQRAMDSPHFNILAHPCGRLLLQREPYPLDIERVIAHAKQRGCFLELNAQPQRLDLDDHCCRLAKHQGVLLSIASDAHRASDFDLLEFGIGQARRGCLEAADALNSRSLAQLRRLLR
ncbi:DNA polymerase/3'-5' exonuclease PolX [Pseudomonas zhanjiangensis]|uniref:DNA polymerase beta n=1 Tax=Pseudomonas zhanjiangensis TaxID=3239015 RepID=A0ABV3YQ38_9PSED